MFNLVQKFMPIAMENFAITQHTDTIWYVTIRGGGY